MRTSIGLCEGWSGYDDLFRQTRRVNNTNPTTDVHSNIVPATADRICMPIAASRMTPSFLEYMSAERDEKGQRDADFCRHNQRQGGLLAGAPPAVRRDGPPRIEIGRRGMPLAVSASVNIRIVSSLNDEDEDRFASIVLSAMDDLLLQMPVAYSVRIETTAGNVLQRSRAGDDRDGTSGQDQIIVKGVAPRDLSQPAGRTIRPRLASGRGTGR